jgi:hypothetical protein
MTQPRFNGAASSKSAVVSFILGQEYNSGKGFDRETLFRGPQRRKGHWGKISSELARIWGNHQRRIAPHKHLIGQNKTAAKWEDFAAGKFLWLLASWLAQGNRLRGNMADLATCNTDICQIAVIHRRQLAEGLAFGALISAVGTECIKRLAQLGHQTRNRCGGICGCIAHFLFSLSRLCGGLSTAFGLVCSVSVALAV